MNNTLFKYIDKPINEAMHLKGRVGQISLRKIVDPFVGNPLEELFEECLDGMNYSNECWNQQLISRETRQRWYDNFKDMATEAQRLWLRNNADNHLGAVRDDTLQR